MDAPQPVALIADDDEFFRMALRTVLVSKLGFADVIETGSLDEALERLTQSTGVSLALFDLAMPGMKSAASLGAVREFFPNLRIAVVSGSKRRQDILLALEAGVHGYVPKSMGPLELVNALKLINAGVIYIPPSLACLPTASEEEQEQSKADPEKRALAEALTPRQKDVLELLIQGRSNKAIAQTLNLGEGTVKVHMAALFRAFGVNSRSAVAVAGAQVLSSRG